MASTPTIPIIADRNDIHKSCKSLELVVNILNDYSEAANAVVQLEKKLVKALREIASNKCTTEIPANALNTSATIFETLMEVDSKFAKFADNQCGSIRHEVKRWFRKLAKEERAHDDKMADANAKIKQAGLAFEKKSRKSPQGADEEHTRYMNLLTTLGSEVNQDKYNHGLSVTQRQISTLYSLGSHVSRIADAEWQRACESVRRFSPTVGQLGEWRAHCEGGWSGAIPGDLPEVDDQPDNLDPAEEYDFDRLERSTREITLPVEHSVPEYSSRSATPLGQSPAPPHYVPSAADYIDQNSEKPRDPFEHRAKPATSLAVLASFPSPPAHFPTPEMTSLHAEGTQNARSGSSSSSAAAPFPPISESPTPESASQTPALTEGSLSPSQRNEPLTPLTLISNSAQLAAASSQEGRDSVYSELTNPHSNVAAERENDQSTDGAEPDDLDDSEFGVRKSAKSTQESPSRNTDDHLTKPAARTDTMKSSGSIVAALRDRYAKPTSPSSPPPRNPPRLPTNVASLAGRYEPLADTATSPRLAPLSPTRERRRTSLDNFGRFAETPSAPAYGARHAPASPRSNRPAEEAAFQRQRQEELEKQDYREYQYERELRMREHEIQQQARELELQRKLLLNARNATGKPDGYTSDSSNTGHAARGALSQRPRYDSASSPYAPYTSYAAHLVPPLQASLGQRAASQPSSPNGHAPYCGCDVCSASKYRARDSSPSARDLRQAELPVSLRPDKPKGWIRRLSMPVMGNAFASDSKKGLGIAGGVGFRSSLDLPGEDGRLTRDNILGGIRNRSATNLARR